MKLILTFLVLVSAIAAQAQSYFLPAPSNWGTETFPIPIDFAPKIPFVGFEEVRFSPGWADTNSEQLWSYCFLWWIQPDSRIDAALLNAYLQDYYRGLVARNVISRKIESSKVVPTVASFAEVQPGLYKGTVKMLDYMSVAPITLNITVQVKPCTAEKKKAVFFSISPQKETHAVWKEFAEIWNGFKCRR